jgi:SAM-dependent methyltransferase
MSWDKEYARIFNAYQQMGERLQEEKHFFTYRDCFHLFRLHERYWKTLSMLNRAGISSLVGLRILDVGCGDANMLRQFMQWGALPEDLAGIELRPEPVQKALMINPNLDVRQGSAVELPWPDETFDLICQNTVFTSILDSEMKKQIATEMVRTLRTGGAILWYDFIYNNPGNSEVRGIGASEIHTLFPKLKCHLHRITLAPPLARRIPKSLLPVLYPMLAALPFLRTHYLGMLQKTN